MFTVLDKEKILGCSLCLWEFMGSSCEVILAFTPLLTKLIAQIPWELCTLNNQPKLFNVSELLFLFVPGKVFHVYSHVIQGKSHLQLLLSLENKEMKIILVLVYWQFS